MRPKADSLHREVARTASGSVATLVLEGNLHLCTVGVTLTVLELHVQLDDLDEE